MEQYYRVKAFISEEALVHNLGEIRSRLDPAVWVLGVVKADAYGHSADLCAPILEREGVDYFAVAIVEEGVHLREIGITKPILVLGYADPSQYEAALGAGLSLTLFDPEQAALLSELALSRGEQAKVHLKIDTGMGRIGLPCDEKGLGAAVRILEQPGLFVEGIFTHFARADEEDKTPTETQYELFTAFCDTLAGMGYPIPVRHCANSAAIMEFPQATAPGFGFRRMVRAGIMLYGLYPSLEMKRPPEEGAMDLHPVLTLGSHLVHVKTVPAGTPISYGASYVTDGKRRIATLPVGYADGYSRRLSNRGFVEVCGKRAPIRGRICMDQFMVDVTEIPEAARGCEALLIGPRFGAEEMAELCGTIHYELTCALSERVPRELDR